MKKPNEIDDLFARKLSRLESTPSPDLWQRIEQRQKKEPRRLGGWMWYAAASVTVLLMAGYLVWQNQTQTTNPVGRTAQTEQGVEPKAGNRLPTIQRENTESVAVQEKEFPTREAEPKVPVEKRVYAASDKGTLVGSQVVERKPTLENVEVAAVERTATNPKLPTGPDEGIRSLQPVEVPSPTNPETTPEALQDRVVFAQVEVEDPASEAQKPSKFLRVLRQLKNVKRGDEVEWDELGFNPKRILARADERLRNGEEKISDKYQQLKEKTKL